MASGAATALLAFDSYKINTGGSKLGKTGALAAPATVILLSNVSAPVARISMAVMNVASTTTHTSVSSLSSRVPGSTPLWQVGLQLRSSQESKRNTCSTTTEDVWDSTS